METLEGLDDRALALDGGNLQILRWGSEQERVPLANLTESSLVRDDKRSSSAATRSGCASALVP